MTNLSLPTSVSNVSGAGFYTFHAETAASRNRGLKLSALFAALLWASSLQAVEPQQATIEQTMKQAAEFYHRKVATHGGYVYHYSLDLSQRWGEGEATKDQIWVQPPGTPTVGLAYLAAFDATKDRFYLDAATDCAKALVYGQVRSGGWTNCIDFNPRGERTSTYRNGRGRGRNTSSLDDGQTASALLLLIRTDAALRFRDSEIHEAVLFGLDALLAVQYPNGAFPQVWDDDQNPTPPIRKAEYPQYDWRTEGRIKNYWDMYTLNDNVPGYVLNALEAAAQVYEDDRFMDSIRRLGDFLILAQMPDPQPGWAQQYNYDMNPIWARKFEPPAVSGDETQEAIETLLKIHLLTGDLKYLAPVPRALKYLERSELPDGRLARYYELQTNRPLYMERSGDRYSLTYDDTNLPDHYGWKTEARITELQDKYEGLLEQAKIRASPPQVDDAASTVPSAEVERLLRDLDDQNRWVSEFTGERLVGQLKLPVGTKYLSSDVFSRNLTTLSRYLQQKQASERTR
ncbi:MAG: pectic acid lyase [Planctomycetaceae bacterium]|nr:pectic acid lyase [Planctomycetaceae bacterium]